MKCGGAVHGDDVRGSGAVGIGDLEVGATVGAEQSAVAHEETGLFVYLAYGCLQR